MAMGEGIKKGFGLPQARIIDLLPAILYKLGQPIPDDLDGRVPEHWFEETYLRAHPLRFRKALGGERASGTEQIYTPEEKAHLEEALRSLGYLE